MAKKKPSKEESAEEATFENAGQPMEALLPDEDCGCEGLDTEDINYGTYVSNHPEGLEGGSNLSSGVLVDVGPPDSWLVAEIEGEEPDTEMDTFNPSKHVIQPAGAAPEWGTEVFDEAKEALGTTSSPSPDNAPDEVLAGEAGAPAEWLVWEIEGTGLDVDLNTGS